MQSKLADETWIYVAGSIVRNNQYLSRKCILMILKPFQHDHKNRPYVRVNAM